MTCWRRGETLSMMNKVTRFSFLFAIFYCICYRPSFLTYGHLRYSPTSLICCCSVIKSCLNLLHPLNCSTPGFPVLHCLLKFAQTQVHWVSVAIQTSHPLLPLLLLPSAFPSIRIFSSESALHIRRPPKYSSFSFSIKPHN